MPLLYNPPLKLNEYLLYVLNRRPFRGSQWAVSVILKNYLLLFHRIVLFFETNKPLLLFFLQEMCFIRSTVHNLSILMWWILFLVSVALKKWCFFWRSVYVCVFKTSVVKNQMHFIHLGEWTEIIFLYPYLLKLFCIHVGESCPSSCICDVLSMYCHRNRWSSPGVSTPRSWYQSVVSSMIMFLI